MKRDLIGLVGYSSQVLEHIRQGLSPAAITEKLNDDPQFMDKIQKGGFGRIYTRDVYHFLSQELAAAKSLIEGEDVTRDGATVALAAAKERIIGAMALGGEWEAIAKRCLEILERELDDYELEKERAQVYNAAMGPEDTKRPLPMFPYDLITTTRKNILACVTIVQALRGDQQLQAITRINAVNISKGISQDDLFEVLFDVGAELGVNRSAMMKAYTDAIVKRKNRQKSGAIDVEPVPAESGLARRTNYARAINETMNVSDPPKEPAPEGASS